MMNNVANRPNMVSQKKVRIPKEFPYNILTRISNFLQFNVSYLNNNKFFAGCIMILLNVGSKFISIQFSRSTEEYLKMTVTKQIMVFAMAWMGTRDIFAALCLTGIFVIISDHALNEESHFCVVPHKYRVLDKLKASIDANGDSEVTHDELNNAIAILEKAKKEKQKTHQEKLHKMFNEIKN
jgi:hypothetical protein